MTDPLVLKQYKEVWPFQEPFTVKKRKRKKKKREKARRRRKKNKKKNENFYKSIIYKCV